MTSLPRDTKIDYGSWSDRRLDYLEEGSSYQGSVFVRFIFGFFVCFFFKVSSSDDEGALSGMEKLVSSLEKLTRLIVESLKSTDVSKESGIVSI